MIKISIKLFLLLPFLLFSVSGVCRDRDTLYTESFITVREGTKLYVNGDLISASKHDAGIRNSGEIHLTGNLENRHNRLFFWSSNGYLGMTVDTANNIIVPENSILKEETINSPLYQKGKVFFIGKDTQYIFNTDTNAEIFFNNLYVHNHVVLKSDIRVQGKLNLKENLDLNSHTIRLFAKDTFDQWGGTGIIVGESDTSQIIGNGEIIAFKGNYDAPLEDLKTLGFELYSSRDTVSVKLTRKNNHQITSVSNGSISKTFELFAATHMPIDSVVLHYFDRDTNVNANNTANFILHQQFAIRL